MEYEKSFVLYRETIWLKTQKVNYSKLFPLDLSLSANVYLWYSQSSMLRNNAAGDFHWHVTKIPVTTCQ